MYAWRMRMVCLAKPTYSWVGASPVINPLRPLQHRDSAITIAWDIRPVSRAVAAAQLIGAFGAVAAIGRGHEERLLVRPHLRIHMLLIQLRDTQQSALVGIVIEANPVESGGYVWVGEVGPVWVKVATG